MIRKKLETLTEEQKKLTEYMYSRAMRYRNPNILNAIPIKDINRILGIEKDSDYSKLMNALEAIDYPINYSADSNQIRKLCLFRQLIIDPKHNAVLYTIMPHFYRSK